jgi:glycine cleavage system H protein
MNVPSDLKYAKSDEWVRVEGNTATVGISDYAQDALSDIVYVDLPQVGASFAAGAAFGSVESVKAQSDVYLPVAGTVTAVNEALAQTPEVVNSDPFGAGWLVKLTVTDAAALASLMDAAAYEAFCASRAH